MLLRVNKPTLIHWAMRNEAQEDFGGWMKTRSKSQNIFACLVRLLCQVTQSGCVALSLSM